MVSVPNLRDAWPYLTDAEQDILRGVIAAAKSRCLPYRTCANEPCAQRFQPGLNVRLDAIYCGRLCARAQAERERRRRLRSA